MEGIKTQESKGATGRAILIGLALVAFNVYWVTITEMKYRAEATALPIFIYPIFILFWLVVFNNGILRLWPRIQLSTGELLTIYSMIVISTSIASYGMLQDLFAISLHPYQFTTQENEWKELFFHYIPPWFTVSTPDAVLNGYYEGDSSFYEPKHFKAWLRPMLVWTVFTLVLLFMLHCINSLVRRQWVHTERLAFPIIQLPYMLPAQRSLGNSRILIGILRPKSSLCPIGPRRSFGVELANTPLTADRAISPRALESTGTISRKNWRCHQQSRCKTTTL